MALQKQYVQFSKKITVGVLITVFALAFVVLAIVLFMDESRTYTIDAAISVLQTMTTFGSVTISGYMLNSLGEKVARTISSSGANDELDQTEDTEDYS